MFHKKSTCFRLYNSTQHNLDHRKRGRETLPRYKPASGPAYAPSAEEVLGGPDFDPADFPQLGAQDRSYDSNDGLAFPVIEGPGSAQSRDLQAQVLQHAAGFKPDVSSKPHIRFFIFGTSNTMSTILLGGNL